jgi:NAD(P)-dependent dehydrogenase (short-subunit alcohol dehydrogenase family)
MDTGTVVVTGAATGIGRRAAVQLAQAGRHVIVVTRSDERAADVVAEATAAARVGGRVTSIPADLADVAQVRAAAERIAAVGPVQAIVNNAAILAIARRRPRITTDGVEEVFAVNHVAPFVLTTSLRAHLVEDGLDLDDLDSRRRWSPVRAYYRSKLAQLSFAAELRRRDVTAAALKIPSVRLDRERLAAYPRVLQVAYRPKMRVAADPAAVAARYVQLVSGPAPVAGHVDARLRPASWPDGTGDASLGARVWSLTAELARQGSER